MAYYIIHKNNVDHKLNIFACASAGTVEKFIEVKINELEYSPGEFVVIKGIKLPIEITPIQARVTLKTEA